MDFKDRVSEAENQVYSEKHRIEKSQKESQKHAEAAFNRLKNQIGTTPNIHIRLIDSKNVGDRVLYYPPRIQVSFYIEKRKLFSKTMEHHESVIFEINDRDGRMQFLNQTIILGDEFTDTKTYTHLDSSDFEELVGYIASKYGTWKAKYVGSK